MAIVWFDGFDLYGSSADMLANYSYYASTTPTFDSVGGRYGGGSANLAATSATGSAMLCIGVPNSDVYHQIGGWLYFDALVNSTIGGARTTAGTYLDSSTQLHCAIGVTSAGEITIYGDGGTVIATSAPGVVAQGQGSYIEVRIRRHATLGSVQVYQMGELVVEALNVDTIDTSTTVLLGFWNRGTSAEETLLHLDDFYVDSSASGFTIPVGDKRVVGGAPNGDTAQADFTKSTGTTGYTLIDDTGGGNGDTDYIYSATVGHKSEFDITNLTQSGTYYAVAVHSRMKKSDAGARTGRNYIKSSASIGTGATRSPTDTEYTQYKDVFELDPATSSAWTKSGIDALLIGEEVVS